MTARVAPAVAALLALPEEQRHLGVYHLVRQLGKGGFAPVWLAREVYGATELRTVAIKLFAVDDAAPRSGNTSHSTFGRLKREQIVAEARALCQVEHPNIVRFFAIATDQGANVVGLAMEYVHGTPLDKRLEEKEKLSVGETLDVGRSVASALAAVHQVGLVHRDIKPANVIDSTGVYKLIDFGIAATRARKEGAPEASAPASVVLDDLLIVSSTPARATADTQAIPSGTYGYIDPACVEHAAEATPASDLYSLGAMLFECLTGGVPALFAARRHGATGLNPDVLGGHARAPQLAQAAPGVPAPLARLVDALLDPDPSARPSSAEAVAWELERIRRDVAGRARPIPPEEHGPFRGLGRFEQEDRDVYFGRTVETAAGLEMIRARGLVALVGPSGSGKSSLARAGLVPAIVDGELGGWPKRWDTVVVLPGADPRASLRAALEPIAPGAGKASPEELARLLADRARRDERGVVLLVDQLEELVTVSSIESRAYAVQFLARIGAQAIPGIRCIVTARRDLLDELLALGELGRVLTRGTLLVSPLTDAAWEDVLDHALGAYDYRLEDGDMQRTLLQQLKGTSSAMPLVQFALTELWARRDTKARVLPRAALDAIGGIAGALEIHADATFHAIAKSGEQAAQATRKVLLALTTPKGSRATRSLVELRRRAGPETDRVVAQLTRARLIVQESDGFTLAHEALLARWGTLRQWIEAAREVRVRAEELEREAASWEEEKRPADRLLTGRRLRAALSLMKESVEPLPAAAVAYLAAAVARRRRARALAAIPVLAVVAGCVAIGLFLDAQRIKHLFCAAYTLRWQEVECVAPLDDAARHRRPVSFRVTAKQGKVLRVENVGEDGGLRDDDDGYASWEYAYDGGGRVTEVIIRDRRGDLAAREVYSEDLAQVDQVDRYGAPLPFFRGGKASRIVYEYAADGRVKTERFRTYGGVPTTDTARGAYGYSFKRDDRGYLVQYDVLGADGEGSSTALGIASSTRKVDEMGGITEERYKDVHGHLVLGASAYAVVTRSYDRHGNLLQQSYRDAEDRPTIARAGHAEEVIARDDRGHAVKVRFYDAEGVPMPQSRSFYTGWISEFDAHGNETFHAFLDGDDKPVPSVDGYARWTARYDARDNRIEQSFFDEDGKPAVLTEGYATKRSTFDAHGDEIETTLVDAEGHPTIGSDGYAHVVLKYDEHHDLTVFSYFDLDGKAVQPPQLGYAKQTTAWKDGRRVEIAFFDPSGAPALAKKEGYARASHAYDPAGNVLESRYFGPSGRPILVSSAARRVSAYDARGNRIEETLYGVDGNPVSDRYSHAHTVSTFDPLGRETAAKYFDASGKRTPDFNGVAGWTAVYDPQGRQTELVYVGTEDLPELARYDGYARVTTKYDDQGHLVDRAYFGADGGPVLHGSAARETFAFDGAGDETAHAMYDASGVRTQLERSKWSARKLKVETAYLDENDKPTQARAGYARQTRAFDDRGYLVEQAFYDEAGALTIDGGLHVAKVAMRFDARGHELSRAYFGVDDKPLLHDGAAKRELRYDAGGNQVEESYFGTDGKKKVGAHGYASVSMKHNRYRQVVEKAFFDAAGKRALDDTTRTAGVTFSYDAFGRQTERAYIGIDGQPSRGPDGYWKVTTKFDEQGKEIEKRYFNVDGKPLAIRGVARVTHTYDDRGGIASIRFFGTDDKPTNDEKGISVEVRSSTVEQSFYDKDALLASKDGYGRKVSKLDAQGRPLEVAYYGADARPILYDGYDDGSPVEAWRVVRAYDGAGKEIERVFFGTDGKRHADKYGVAIRRFSRDEHGNVVSESWSDADDKPVLHRELGYAKEANKYDGQQRVVDRAFFGTKDELVLPKGGALRFARATWTYDARGYETSLAYFGPDGKPMITEAGYATKRSTYDKAGNRVGVAYFGVDDAPLRDKNGVAGWRSKFNGARQETERTYFDEAGNPTLFMKRYARYTAAFDLDGYETERRYFDAAGGVATDANGCAVVKLGHGRGSETKCLDAQGKVRP